LEILSEVGEVIFSVLIDGIGCGQREKGPMLILIGGQLPSLGVRPFGMKLYYTFFLLLQPHLELESMFSFSPATAPNN